MLLESVSTMDFIGTKLVDFLTYTGFANVEWANIIMIAVGAFFIWLAIAKDFEPLLLIPIGLGIILGNIPFKDAGLEIGLYEDNSVLNIFYQGVRLGWYPPLVFLGIGAMTDFSALIANPKLMLIGAAAQFGIFGAYMVALALGFEPNQAAGIAIIGGADGPTAIFLSSKLSPNLMGAIMPTGMGMEPIMMPRAMMTKMGMSRNPPLPFLSVEGATEVASRVVGSFVKSMRQSGRRSMQVTIMPTTAKG